MITIHVDHVMTNMAADLCVRYPQVACERIEAMSRAPGSASSRPTSTPSSSPRSSSTP